MPKFTLLSACNFAARALPCMLAVMTVNAATREHSGRKPVFVVAIRKKLLGCKIERIRKGFFHFGIRGMSALAYSLGFNPHVQGQLTNADPFQI